MNARGVGLIKSRWRSYLVESLRQFGSLSSVLLESITSENGKLAPFVLTQHGDSGWLEL